MKDNRYFDRFLQYIVANLIAAVCYFLLAACLGMAGAAVSVTASHLLSSAVTVIPFALAVFVSTLRDKKLRGRDLRAYFADTGVGDLITYAVWSVCGAMIAVAGEAAGIAIYIFLAQALPAASLSEALGPAVGLPLTVLGSAALYTAARVCGILAKKEEAPPPKPAPTRYHRL